MSNDDPMKSRVHIKVDDDLKGLVAQAAASDRKTVTSWITTLLIRELKRLGLYVKPKSSGKQKVGRR